MGYVRNMTYVRILWDFIVLGLILSWWRIEHELKNKWISQEAREKLTRERAM